MKYAAKTITGIRKQNQDAVFIPERGMIAIAAVADGMGGHNAGDIASALAIKTLVENMHKNAPGTIRERLINAVNMANSAVYELSFSDEGYHGMGTTLVAAVLEEKRFIAANVGDSRLYIVGGTEQIRQITRDHSLVDEMVRMGEINADEARVHPDKNIITRAVGAADHVEADFFEVELCEEDRILLCTDGLTNMVEDDSIRNIIKGQRDIAEKAEKLVETANRNGGKDNITVVVIEPFSDEVKKC